MSGHHLQHRHAGRRRDDAGASSTRVNDIVAAEGGRVYLTKDAFTRAEHYRAMDPRIDGFNAIRRRWDPDGRIRSALSVRLLGDAA